MKATHKLFAGLALAGLAVSVAFADRPMPRKVSKDANGPTMPGVASSALDLNISTGFEPGVPDGYDTVGFINNGAGVFPTGCGGAAFPCWGHTAAADASTITPTIDTVHPATGTQHLRLTPDPSTRTNMPDFDLGVDARYPRTADLSVGTIAPNTVSIDMAITVTFGQDFRVQPQSNSQGFLATSALFLYNGQIFILDDLCETDILAFRGTGAFWDTTGNYQNYTVVMNPCFGGNTITYHYAGNQIYAGCTYAGTNLEQFLVFGDNFPAAEFHGDNLVMQTGAICPTECGNGVIEAPIEACEPGNVPTGCAAGHPCGAVGAADECQCGRACTLANPCILENGANGPFTPPFDASFGGIFLYFPPAGVEAVSVELCGSTGADQRIFFWGSAGGAACPDGTACLDDTDCTPSDPGSCAYDAGNANDDCYGGPVFGEGSDPTASCYDQVTSPNYEPCTCWDIPEQYDPTYLLQIRQPAAGGEVFIEVNKKSECFAVGGHLGACCDTNGADVGCTDNLVQADCLGVDKVWTENGKCVDLVCECIPLCEGHNCGGDGCGGQCPVIPCDDSNVCTDDSCDDLTGLCVYTPNTGPCTDDNGCTDDICGGGQCVSTPNTAPCDDADACTTGDVCAGGACTPGGPTNCDDGLVCNGAETCVAPGGCVAGTPPVCNDGNACNGVETCTEPNGCTPGTPPVCDDGVFCNGSETCVAPGGCVSGAAPTCDDGVDCTVDSCDTATDACVNDDAACAIPTVSEWGLVVLALMLLIGAKVYFGRRQAIA